MVFAQFDPVCSGVGRQIASLVSHGHRVLCGHRAGEFSALSRNSDDTPDDDPVGGQLRIWTGLDLQRADAVGTMGGAHRVARAGGRAGHANRVLK